MGEHTHANARCDGSFTAVNRVPSDQNVRGVSAFDDGTQDFCLVGPDVMGALMMPAPWEKR